MIIIRNENTDPYFNIASEEYLLDSEYDRCFMLWRNENAVIVGKNQNALSEIDREFTESNGIKVVRRLTGGGAVFHDLGNINFTYIEKASDDKFNNYELFTKDIIDYLATFGIKAYLSGRNDILIEGKKISGNAQCIRNRKIMHHGCILYSSDIGHLTGALKVSKAKIESKGIKSVSSRVSNICDFITNPPSVTDFIKGLENFIKSRYNNCTVKNFSQSEEDEIQNLANSKYGKYEWNFGYSPDYNFQKSEKYPFGLLTVSLNVSEGIIKDIGITGDFFGEMDLSDLCKKLCGIAHRTEDIRSALIDTDIDRYIKGCSTENLIKLFI